MIVVPAGSTHVEINAAIASVTDGVVGLEIGIYTLGAALLWREGVALVGKGSRKTQLQRLSTWLPSVGLADDPTNNLISITGAAVAGGFSSILSARANRGDATLTVTTTTGIVANRRYRIQGANLNDEGSSEGASQLTTEVVEVASVDSGTVVTLKWPCQVHHASGHAIVEVTTIRDATIEGVRLDATGGRHAVGIHARMVERLRLYDVDVAGFSRMAIEMDHGGWDVEVDGVYSRGEVNGIVGVNSCHGVKVRGVRCSPSGLRYHANGVARALLWMPNDGNAVRFSDCELRRGTQAIAIRSGHDVHVTDVTCDDFIPDEGYNRQVTAGEHTAGSQFGIVTGGANPSAYNARTQGLTMKSVSIGECFTTLGAGPTFYCFFLHDTYFGEFNGLRALNSGKGATVNGNLMRGLRATDCGSILTDYVCKGYQYGVALIGNFGLSHITNVTYDFVAAAGGNGDVGLLLDVITPPISFQGVTINATTPVQFGTNSPAAATPLRIRDFVNAAAGVRADEVQLVVNNTGGVVNVPGAVYEIEQATGGAVVIAGLAQFKGTTGVVGKNTMVFVAGNAADNERCLAAIMPQRVTARVRNEGADRAPGGLLETVNASTDLAFNAASANPTARLLELHPTGAIALRNVGVP